MVDLLADNPLVLLFLVVALGYLAGSIRVGGFALGVAAVLFVGIGFGAIDDRLQVPEAIWSLGLVVFVYTVGLSAAPGFVSSFRRRGLAANAVLAAALAASALVAWAGSLLLDLGTAGAGVFAGGLTNTPALAAALERLQNETQAAATAPVVGYSLTYPLGVLVPLLLVFLLARGSGSPAARREPPELVAQTVRVERDGLPTLLELRERIGGGIAFGRLLRAGTVTLAAPDVVPLRGDQLSVVGPVERVRAAVAQIGVPSAEHLELERAAFEVRRVLVTNRGIAGRRLGELDLEHRYGAAVTRLRRGEVVIMPGPETDLELGDRVRVLAPRRAMPDVVRLLGDSFRQLGEFDPLSIGIGLAAGLLLGLVPVPLPGGGEFELGLAGGPLVVALVLGALGRTGPVVWQVPYSANLTLRQIGVVLFLAGVGTRAGGSFADTVASAEAARVAGTGLAVTLASAGLFVLLARRLLHLSPGMLAGALAGAQTQPAVLTYASQRHDEQEVNLGWATVYPLAVIAKIVVAQLLAAALA